MVIFVWHHQTNGKWSAQENKKKNEYNENQHSSNKVNWRGVMYDVMSIWNLWNFNVIAFFYTWRNK